MGFFVKHIWFHTLVFHTRLVLCNFTKTNFNFFFHFAADLGQEKESLSTNSNNTIQFAVLMRKGPKQTLKELAVPKDSDMAQNLLKQEEAQRLEKEKMKKLTLEINERQEEEDLNEAIAMVSLVCLLYFSAVCLQIFNA